MDETRLASVRKDCDEYPASDYGELLVDLCGEVDVEWVHVLLERGADVNFRRADGRTALASACAHPESDDSVTIVKTLLEAGASAKVEDQHGDSPLRWATHYNAPTVCELLLEAGADPNVRDRKGRSILLRTVASAEYKPEIAGLVPMLLAAGADPNVPDDRSETPLRLACSLGLHEAAAQLLDAGADIRGASSKTPLVVACLREHAAIVQLLLERGADVHEPYRDEPILDFAEQHSTPEIVDLLLEAAVKDS